MTTNASIGFGTIFQMLDRAVSPDTYVDIAEVTSITMPNLSRDAVDATHMQSPDGWREFIPGLKDAGEVTVELNFVFGNASEALILAQFATKTLSACKILFIESPETGVSFSAIVTGFERTVPLDDKMTATMTLKVSGTVTVL
jgi:predicted secreted protein